MRVFCDSYEQVNDVFSRALHYCTEIRVVDCSGTEVGYWVDFDRGMCSDEEIAHVVGNAVIQSA